MLYSIYETQKRGLKPVADIFSFMSMSMKEANGLFHFNPIFNVIKAQTDWLSEFTKTYPKPSFNIKTINVKDNIYDIKEEIVVKNDFCELIHFKKIGNENVQPPMLIVAPLSGHFATLLRDTVNTTLKDFDVYVTDWINPVNIPKEVGDFGFDDYVQYVINYIDFVHTIHGKGNCNVMAICQPTVPTLTAIAYLDKYEPEKSPKSVTVMGGPIDTRMSPTKVNKYAMAHDINWFKKNVVHVVPGYFKGAGRQVYPGFLQYAGFVSMNFKKHKEAHIDFFNHLLKGADLDIQKHKDFYDEYNAVMDLPGKYYIETLERVFIDQQLAKGTMIFNGKKVSLSDIRNVKILAIEGENDDISGREQTFAVLDLTDSLSQDNKVKFLAPDVGHYGIFSGRRWRDVIYPEIVNFAIESKEVYISKIASDEKNNQDYENFLKVEVFTSIKGAVTLPIEEPVEIMDIIEYIEPDVVKLDRENKLEIALEEVVKYSKGEIELKKTKIVKPMQSLDNVKDAETLLNKKANKKNKTKNALVISDTSKD